MAKQTDKILVECKHCIHGGAEVVNIMIDCFNHERNPKGFKIGAWERECSYFKQR